MIISIINIITRIKRYSMVNSIFYKTYCINLLGRVDGVWKRATS